MSSTRRRRAIGRAVAVVVLMLVSSVSGFLAGTAPASAAGVCGPPVTSVVACENTLPGDPRSDWQVAGSGDAALQGFSTKMSVEPGDTVSFKVNASAAAYHVDILRFGYYQGNGARKVATLAGPYPKNTQPTCTNQINTGLIDCGNWSVSLTWAVPSSAVSGIYAAHLVRNDTGGSSMVPFVVRDSSSHSDIVVQASDTTWQAYNTYGGNSLYSCTGSCPPGSPLAYKGASKVSYNRPFHSAADDSGRSWLTYAELPMISFLEANGYDVSYLSGTDVDSSGSLLLNHDTFVSSGHDEYWSGNQRANVEYARDHGVNLAFFSGNEVFWKTRWEPDSAGNPNRVLVSYKDTHYDAPTDPVEWTGTWRDPRFRAGQPENALTGQYFTVNSGTTDIKVPSQYSALRMWRGTAVASLGAGQSVTLGAGHGTLGYEWDVEPDNGFRPTGLFDLSSTTSSTAQVFNDYGSAVTDNQTATHHLSLYRAPSGALVFGAGTVQWAWGLDANNPSGGVVDRTMQQATVNLLADMGAQPATLIAGLTATSASTNRTPPSSTVASPAAGAAVADGTRLTVSGTATASGGSVVAGVEVSTDSGSTWHPATIPSAAASTTWSYSWVAHGNPSTTVRSRAVDDNGNIETPSAGSLVNVSCPCSVWGANVTPGTVDENDINAVELGVKFKSDVGGSITGVRFYKSTANTGTHIGNLWSSTGALLATATFTSETASGWQQVTFSAPVPIVANTVYIASYFAPRGHYSADGTYLYGQPAPASGAAGITDSAPLHVVRHTTTSGNGLYRYSASSAFPTSTYNGENYWVDVSFVPNAPPTAPAQVTGVVATARDASAVVSWSAPSNGGSPITSYTVTPRIAGVPQTPTIVTGSPPATTTTVTGLTNGTAYTFTVAATNSVGTGSSSTASAPVTPVPATVPGQVTGVSAVARNASVDLSWTAPLDGGATITAYTVTPSVGGVPQAPVAISGIPPVTASTITGLTNGVTYTFTVTAANVVGTGASSPPSAAVTPSVPISPVLDVQVSTNATGTTATTPTFSTAQPGETLVAFVAADGPQGAAQTLTVSGAGLTWTLAARSNAQAGASEVWTATATAKLTGVTVSSTESRTGYHQMLTVLALQSSSGVGAVQTANAATGAPTASVTTTRSGSLIYGVGNDWDNAIGRTVGTGQAMASQWVDTGAGDTFWLQNRTTAAASAGTLLTINDTAPTADRWNLAVVEVKGPASATAPGAPTGVSAVAGNSSATVSWPAPPDGGSSITSYRITPYIGAVAQTPTTISGSPPATSAIITGLANGSAYTFTVTASNAIGTGPASSASAAVTPTAPTVPGAPTGVTAAAGDGTANVSWTAPPNGGSPITSYTVTPYLGAVAQTPTTITGSPPTTSVTVTGLTNFSTYTFVVTATNAIGSGPASAPSAAVTPTGPTVPAAPTGVSAVAGNATANVSWTAPSNGGSPITSYTITPYIAGVAQTATTITGSPPATSATVAGLTNGTAYTFTVRAANIIGTGPASGPSVAVTPTATSSPIVDVQVSVNGTGTTATTPSFSTAQAGEMLLAFAAADGPTASGAQTVTVTGAGLTWTLVRRSNAQFGTAEVWTATAPAKLTGVSVSATETVGGFHQMLTVVAVQGSSGIGAVQAANAASGAPSVSLTTTRASSLVFAVGNDWDSAAARVVGAGQSIVSQWVDSTVGDTFWTQRLTAPTGAVGSVVTINDTTPTSDRWNLCAVEIKGL